MAILRNDTTVRSADGQTTSPIITAANIGNYGISTTSTYYIGTTQNVFNRASGAQTLTGVSIDGNAATVTNGVYTTGTQTIGGAKTFSDGITVNTATYNTFTKPSPSTYQTVALFGSTGGGLFLTTDNPIIGVGAYYNTSWIATATSGRQIDFAGGNFTFSAFSGATIGGAASWGTVAQLSSAGVFSATGDFRAPIFYDTNNTAYYCDPASVSNLNAVTLNRSGSDGYLTLPGSVTVSNVSGAEMVIRGLSQLRFSNSTSWDWNSWAGLRYDNAGTTIYLGGPAATGIFTQNATPPTVTVSFVGTNNVTSDSNFKAPIFYDSANTAYYLDPANTGTSLLVAGNVGIGNTSPSAKLHVLGASYTTASAANNNVRFEGGGGNGLGFGTIDATSTYASWIQSGYVPNFATATYALLLNPLGGNVGIGTTSPTHKLHVYARGNGAGVLIESDPTDNANQAPALKLYPKSTDASERNWSISPFRNYAQSLSISSSDSKGGDPYSNATTRLIIDGINGNVGIGTISPSQKLHVVGTGFASTDFRAPIFYDSDNTSYYLDAASTSSFNALNLASTLAVNGGDGIRVFKSPASSITSQIYWANGANTIAYNWQIDENNNAAMWGYGGTAWAKLLTVTSGGGVGIGTSTISQKLNISGNIMVAPASSSWAEGLSFTMPTTSTWGGLRWRREVANNDGNHYVGYTGLDSTDDLVFGSNNAGTQINNNIRITKAGLVGIGTAPSQKFHVSGIGYSDTDFRAPLFYDSNDTNYYVDPASTTNLLTLSVNRINNLRPYVDTWHTSTDGTRRFYFANGGTTYYSTANNYVFRNASDVGVVTIDGSGNLRTSTSGDNYASYSLHVGGTGFATADFRSPIFYDSNDTNYYADPASTSVFNRLKIDGGNFAFDYFQSLSDFTSGTLVTTDIPATAAEGESFVMNVVGKSYSASASPFNFTVQGYLYSSTIINFSGIKLDSTGLTSVKIFENGGVLCFWWPTISYWNAFEVSVRAYNNAKNNYNRVTNITNSTEPVGTKKVTVTLQSFLRADVSATNSVDLRAPIFYDSNDTTYYTDPSSLSNILELKTNKNWYDTSASVWGGGINMAGNSPSIGFQSTASTWWYMLHHSSSAINFYRRSTSGSWNQDGIWDSSGNFIWQGSSVRGQIFYDQNNTAYYIDAASGSNLNNVTVAGTLTLTNIAKNSTAPIVINSGQSASLGLRVYYDMNLYNTLTFTDSAWNSQGSIFGSSSVVTINAATATTSFVKYAGYSQEGGSFRAPIFYDSDNTSYYIDAAGTSSLNNLNLAGYVDIGTYIYLRNNLRMLNSAANGWLETIVRNSGSPYFQNSIDGGTFLASDVSENNNWLFQENVRGWGIFYFNRGTQSGQTFGSYTTIGAETFIIGQGTGTTMTSTWTGYNASSKVAIMLSNYSGYIWANDTIFSATGMRAPIFYDSDDTNFYANPAGESKFNYLRLTNNNALYFTTTGVAELNNEGNSTNVAFRMIKSGSSNSDGNNYGVLNLQRTNHTNAATNAGASIFFELKDSGGTIREYAGISGCKTEAGAAGGRLIFHRYARTEIGYWDADQLFANASMRSPIFYDSDNTGYYLNPAGLSQLSAVYANDWFRAQGNTGLYFQDKGYGITSAGAASNSYGNASTYGSGVNGWQGWGIGSRHCMMSTGGDNFGVHDNTKGGWLYYWDGTYHRFQYGYLESANSVRGPLFYDSDNTAYYCDPASTSNLNAITAAGNITAAQYYTGGWFRNSTSGNGLYNESTGQHFYSDSANYWNVASSAGAQGIRFRTGGHNGTVRGYVYANDSNDVGFLNSGGNWRARIVGGDYALFDGSSIRGQIFYDSNDTNYYCDPNGTSSFAAVNANAYYPHGGVTESDIYARSLSINAYHHGDSLTYDTFQFNAASTYETRATVGASFVSGTVETSIFKGDRFGGMTIANGVYQVRWTWNNTIGYKFFKTLYIANSTNGNSFTVTIESSANGSTWTTIATTGAMSNWPGHSWYNYFWNNNAYQGYIRLTITPSWSTANDINIYSMRYFCSYSLDAGSRLYDWDYSKNITFAANVSAPIFYDSNNTAYYIDPANSGTSLLVAGNVGIGTTSPTQKLDIVGSYGAADDNSGILKIRGPGVGPTQLNFGVSADGGYGWIQATNIAVDNDRDIILGPLGGNIGIGTTSPSQKLHIVGTGFASNDFRSPIFYDSNDTGYYLDPAGTSNLNKLSAFTMSYNDMNSMHVNSPYVARYNGSALYRNGTMGYGTTDCNVMFSNWGSGFIDSWGSPANAPGGSTHYVGLQGFHYNHQNNSQAYGFQMLCAGEADNRFFWRSAWPNLRSWVEMIHSGNIGSQTVATAGSCTGNAATATRTSGQSGYPHAGTGMWAFYNWGGSDGGTSAPSASTYTTGLSVGSNPGDQAYGFQIANNMWNTGLWTRNYNSGFGSWIRLLDSSNYVGYSAFTGNVDGTQFRDANNTAYYIDPASTSNLVGLTVANTITGAVSGNAGSVTINYNNDSNSTYQMLWGSGNNVYGTAGVYLNPSTDVLYANAFYDAGNTAYYLDPNSTSNLLLVKTRNTFGERIAVTAASSTTIDTQYNVTELTMSTNVSLTLSNIQSSGTVHMWTIVTVGNGTAYSIGWPAAIKWPGGTAPTITSTNTKRDIYQFVTYDGGTNIYAIIVGQNL